MSRTDSHPNGKIALSVLEVADALSIGRTMAWKLVNDGMLPSFRLGRRVLVHRDDVEAFVAQRRAQALHPRRR